MKIGIISDSHDDVDNDNDGDNNNDGDFIIEKLWVDPST